MANEGKHFPAEVYSRDTVARLLGQFGLSPTDVRNKALVLVYLRAQLRLNEALDLNVSDVDFDRRAITVLRGKGGKRRTVGVDPETLLLIKAWLQVRPDKSAILFCTHKGTRLDDSYVRKMVKRVAKRAGIQQRVHVHGFRHTGACRLADQKVDMRVIQKQLGHSSLAVTDRYLDHLGANDVIETVSNVAW